jgi:hypothetical protein
VGHKNEHNYTTDVYESTTYIYSCLLKSQTVKLSTCPCLYSTILYKFAGSKFWVFESLHKEKHINSTRKKVQSATQRKIHRKPAQFFENSTKQCEIYFDQSVKGRHFETAAL